MTLNTRFNFTCALRTARLTYVCCGFRSCIVKALNGFRMTQRQMTLKDECWYIMLENFIGHVFRALFSWYFDMTIDYSRVEHLRFCGVLCIARSVSQPIDRHAQLTHWFSAVAELLVVAVANHIAVWRTAAAVLCMASGYSTFKLWYVKWPQDSQVRSKCAYYVRWLSSSEHEKLRLGVFATTNKAPTTSASVQRKWRRVGPAQ